MTYFMSSIYDLYNRFLFQNPNLTWFDRYETKDVCYNRQMDRFRDAAFSLYIYMYIYIYIYIKHAISINDILH